MKFKKHSENKEDVATEVQVQGLEFDMGYPGEPTQDFYLVYKIEEVSDEVFLNRKWDILKLEEYKGAEVRFCRLQSAWQKWLRFRSEFSVRHRI